MTQTHMKAIKIVEQGKAEVQSDIPVPKVKGEWILVKVSHVALNPTDWKHIDYFPAPGATVGFDYAGTVQELGPEVDPEMWKTGDRIAGVAHGCNSMNLEDGTFAEYALVKAGLQLHVPDDMPDEQAATLGVGLTTVGQALYQKLQLPLPGSVDAAVDLFIYGGSAATGTLAIQFAKLSGARVLTTCSPKNFDLVKSFGADEIYDYSKPDDIEKIKASTHGKLHYILDCIGGEDGSRICSGVISSKGGQIASIAPGTEYSGENVRSKLVMAYTAEGEPISVAGVDSPGIIEDYTFMSIFYRLAERLLSQGNIKTHPVKLGAAGFEGVLQGLQDMREGKVSGQKLVYRICG